MNTNRDVLDDDFPDDEQTVESSLGKTMTAEKLSERFPLETKAFTRKQIASAETTAEKQPSKTAVSLIKSRAPELVEQYKEAPKVLEKLALDIDALEPMVLIPEYPPETPYPTDALLGMTDAVNDIANIMSFPAAMVAQSALGVANALIHGLVNVVLPSGGPSPTSLFLMTGADSGEGKSRTDKILTRALNSLSDSAQNEYEEELRNHHIRMELYEDEVKSIRKGLRKDAKDADAARKACLIRDVIKPVRPMNPMHETSDFTIEGLRNQFQFGCSRLSIMTDEGATWMEGHALINDRVGSTFGIVCVVWDGKAWNFIRGEEGKSCSLKNRRLAISVSTQNSVLTTLLTNQKANDQGFLARCLIGMPDSLVHQRKMTDVNWEDHKSVSQFNRTMATLYNTPLITKEKQPYCLDPRTVKLDQAAKNVYMDYCNKRFRKISDQYALIRALALKADQHIGRLAANLAVWENPETGIINKHCMEAACCLMDYYLMERIRFVTSGRPVSSSSFMNEVFHALDWMKKKGVYVVFPGFLQRHPMKGKGVKFVEKAMNALVEHGYAIELPKGTIVGEKIKGVLEEKPRKRSWLITG